MKTIMIISCCICCDIFVPDSVLWHLKCGHIFHEKCLFEWMKRSKTCPQCRKKTFRPTRVYPNYTISATLDDVADQMLESEKERFRITLAEKDKDIASIEEERERARTNLAAREADVALMEATMKVANETHNKEMQNLRNQIIIFEERIKDLLFEMSAAKLGEKENLDKLDQCRLELRNAQIDLNGRMKLIECFERVNEQLQVRQNEIEVENNRLREQVRTLLSSASPKLKRKVAMDEFISQHQKTKKIVIDLDDEENGDDDCVIVLSNQPTESILVKPTSP